MIIRNIKSYPIFFPWIPPYGKRLEALGTVEVKDEIAATDDFKDSINRGYVEVVSWDNDDFSFVIQKEMKDYSPGGPGSGEVFQVDRFSASANQTIFQLTRTPSNSNFVICSIGGIEHTHINDYYVDASHRLIWVSTIPIEAGDEVVAKYHYVP